MPPPARPASPPLIRPRAPPPPPGPGASLLAFWQQEHRAYASAGRPYSSVNELLEGDPYLKCARGAGPSGKALLVELDVAALARDGARALTAAFDRRV